MTIHELAPVFKGGMAAGFEPTNEVKDSPLKTTHYEKHRVYLKGLSRSVLEDHAIALRVVSPNLIIGAGCQSEGCSHYGESVTEIREGEINIDPRTFQKFRWTPS